MILTQLAEAVAAEAIRLSEKHRRSERGGTATPSGGRSIAHQIEEAAIAAAEKAARRLAHKVEHRLEDREPAAASEHRPEASRAEPAVTEDAPPRPETDGRFPAGETGSPPPAPAAAPQTDDHLSGAAAIAADALAVEEEALWISGIEPSEPPARTPRRTATASTGARERPEDAPAASRGASVRPAEPGVLGFDTDTPIGEQAASLRDAGYRFCLRYLSLGTPQDAGDLSQQEVGSILAAGLALMAVQHSPEPGWTPSAQLGRRYGEAAASNAAAIDLPAGLTVWSDLEGVGDKVEPDDTEEFCRQWARAVSRAGYSPGLYVGADSGLDGPALARLPFRHFWRSASDVPDLPGRGYQLLQSLREDPVAGVSIDDDLTRDDDQGGQALWLVSRSARKAEQ